MTCTSHFTFVWRFLSLQEGHRTHKQGSEEQACSSKAPNSKKLSHLETNITATRQNRLRNMLLRMVQLRLLDASLSKDNCEIAFWIEIEGTMITSYTSSPNYQIYHIYHIYQFIIQNVAVFSYFVKFNAHQIFLLYGIIL